VSGEPAYEPVIGLEVHAQLLTQSKMFCSCSASYSGAAPNTHVCPVDLGLPGSLPVANQAAVEQAIMVALALNCQIAPITKFDRKNYPYPDIPKGYQISQYDTPLGRDGYVDFESETGSERCGIIRVHMEEDTGKTIHGRMGGKDVSLVDYNRSGVPLLEIVSHPDLRSSAGARRYFETLREILVYLGVCSGDMQEGALRADINVSVRRPGSEHGVKVEIKNLNSFRAVARAVEFEIDRQVRCLEAGGTLTQETRGWDEAAEKTVPQRSKEFAEDYRYFPEPDLPPLDVPKVLVDAVRSRMPEAAAKKRERYVNHYGLTAYDAAVLTQDPELARLMDQTVAAAPFAEPKAISNWLTGELLRLLHETGMEPAVVPITPQLLAGLLKLLADGTISNAIGKTVFEEMFRSGTNAATIVRERGLTQMGDPEELRQVVEQVLTANPGLVKQYVEQDRKTEGPLIGQVMKATGGKANAAIVKDLIAEKLS